MEWQTIETAPKDGTEVLIWREDCGVLMGRYCSANELSTMSDKERDELDEVSLFQEDWWSGDADSGGHRLEGWEVPTHWMPLPQPPMESLPQQEREGGGRSDGVPASGGARIAVFAGGIWLQRDTPEGSRNFALDTTGIAPADLHEYAKRISDATGVPLTDGVDASRRDQIAAACGEVFGWTAKQTAAPSQPPLQACEFPVCAVHHICERNCWRNAGVTGGQHQTFASTDADGPSLDAIRNDTEKKNG